MKILKESNYLELFVQRIKEVFYSSIIHEQIDLVLNIANKYLEEQSNY